MSDTASQDPKSNDPSYVVVARRYRPRNFEELVGQEHVGRALTNAIETGRVGHAYLFTGARGVGKTSTARIFAKALNNPGGASASFDAATDVAQAIDSGEDIDVIEIDGASNRGIDEIRSLRANVGVRPSRSRYKIYIIDEVHMLTQAAFNALLKTLEEPPEHVKFIFCTTDPEKMPITVLSRCQRFDFSPVEVPKIVKRLREIIEAENAEADEVALELIARRAAGSMRDSQSLLEQVLSFSDGHLTADQVHAMLGTADDERLHALAQSMADRDAAAALKQLDEAIDAGVDAGRIAEQLLGYFRDLMAVSVGCDPTLQRHTAASMHESLGTLGKQWGLQTVLAVVAMIDETLVRIRHSVYGRVLLESTLIQICNLPDLQAIADVAAAASSGQSSPPAQKKKLAASPAANRSDIASSPETPSITTSDTATSDTATSTTNTAAAEAKPAAPIMQSTPVVEPPAQVPEQRAAAAAPAAAEPQPPEEPSPAMAPPAEQIALTQANLGKILDAVNSQIQQMTASMVSLAEMRVAGNDRLEMKFPADAQMAMKRMDLPEHRGSLAEAIATVVGHPVHLNVSASANRKAPAETPIKTTAKPTAKERMERMRQIEAHPWVQTCVETFQAEIVKVDQAS
ncbi:MAG: DNA polymerase III subunit gamma/tau [Planctomycetota bacterium]